MDHRIEQEHLCTIHFEKVLAQQTDKWESKKLIMEVIVDHDKNYISSTYKVTYDYTIKDQFGYLDKDGCHWEYSMIDLAMDKYNEL